MQTREGRFALRRPPPSAITGECHPSFLEESVKTLLSTTLRLSLALGLSLAFAAPTFASDNEAKRLFSEAHKQWDGDPAKVQALLEKAVGEAESKALKLNLTLILDRKSVV